MPNFVDSFHRVVGRTLQSLAYDVYDVPRSYASARTFYFIALQFILFS